MVYRISIRNSSYIPNAFGSDFMWLSICKKVESFKNAAVTGFEASLGIRSGLLNGLPNGTLSAGPKENEILRYIYENIRYIHLQKTD